MYDVVLDPTDFHCTFNLSLYIKVIVLRSVHNDNLNAHLHIQNLVVSDVTFSTPKKAPCMGTFWHCSMLYQLKEMHLHQKH